MGVFTWIPLAASPFALGDVGSAKSFEQTFTGACTINVGTSLYAFLGERQTHVTGNDVKFVNCGSWGGIGGFLGSFVNEAASPVMGLLGMNGDASLCLGPRTSITYGGPVVNVRRGRNFTRTTPAVFENAWNPLSLAATGAAAANDPSTMAATATDRATENALKGLSILLGLVTTALELATHFNYPTYNPQQANQQETPTILNKVDTTVSDLITGIIYGIETAEGLGNYLDQFRQSKVVQYVGTFLGCITLILPAAWAIEKFQQATEDTQQWIIFGLVIAAFLIAIAVLLGVFLK